MSMIPAGLDNGAVRLHAGQLHTIPLQGVYPPSAIFDGSLSCSRIVSKTNHATSLTRKFLLHDSLFDTLAYRNEFLLDDRSCLLNIGGT